MVTRKTASQVRDAVVQAIDPIEVILFGSLAENSSGNDLDLLVVADDRDGAARADIAHELTTALRPFKRAFDIDDYVLTHSEFAEQFRRGSVFLRKIVSQGICIYMKEGIEAWRRQAEEDLRTAEYLLSGGFYRGACYHSRQCVEKSIKTLLLQRGWDQEKIHSIHRLAAIAEDYRLQLPLRTADIDLMDQIYRSRYPAESGLLPLGTPTREDADRSVAVAQRAVRALREVPATSDRTSLGNGGSQPGAPESDGATDPSGSDDPADSNPEEQAGPIRP